MFHKIQLGVNMFRPHWPSIEPVRWGHHQGGAKIPALYFCLYVEEAGLQSWTLSGISGAPTSWVPILWEIVFDQ